METVKNIFFRRTLWVVFFMTVTTAFLAWIFYGQKANFNWDEALHVRAIYIMHRDIEKQDWPIFWSHTLIQDYYPFLQSWIMAVPSVLFGFSILNIRIYSLFWYLLTGFLVFINARKLGEEIGIPKIQAVLAGYLSLFFFIFSPLFLYFASLGMMEMMGTSLILLILTVYFWVRKVNRPVSYLIISLGLFLLLVFKYNYGVFLGAIIALEGFFSFVFIKKRDKTILSHLLIFLPFILLTLAWLYYPVNGAEEPKPQRFLKVITNRRPFTEGMADRLTYLLFYPRAIIYVYSASPPIGAFFLLSLIISLRWWKKLRARVMLFTVWANLISATIATWNMQERYIFIILPLAFILSGVNGIFIYNFLKKQLGRKLYLRISGAILLLPLAVILGKDFLKLPNYVYSVASYTTKSAVYNQPDYTDQYFKYDLSKWPKILPKPPFEKPADVVDWVIANVDLSKPVELVGWSTELAPDYFNLNFDIARETGKYQKSDLYSHYYVTIEVLSGSRFNTWDYVSHNAYLEYYINQVKADPSLFKVREKLFTELGVKASIYGRE